MVAGLLRQCSPESAGAQGGVGSTDKVGRGVGLGAAQSVQLYKEGTLDAC